MGHKIESSGLTTRVLRAAEQTISVVESPMRLIAAGLTGILLLAAFFLTGTLAAISLIDQSAIEEASARASIAVSVVLRDSGAADAVAAQRLADEFGFAGARFTDAAHLLSDEVSVPAVDDLVMAWVPRRYAIEAFERVAPFRLGVATFFMVGVAAILYRLLRLSRDLEKRRRMAAELASRDALTGLGNRLRFDEVLREAIADRSADSTGLALFYLDLDDFKPVNDRYGHPTGDEVLRRVAERLRLSAEPGDTLARLGGDEFALIHRGEIGQQRLAERARSLRTILTAPYRIDGDDIAIDVSIGIAVASDAMSDIAQLVRAADAALYRAKAEGGALHAFADGRASDGVRVAA